MGNLPIRYGAPPARWVVVTDVATAVYLLGVSYDWNSAYPIDRIKVLGRESTKI